MQAVDADIWVLTESHSHVAPGVGYQRIAQSGRASATDADESWVAVWSRIAGTPVVTTDRDRTAAAEMPFGPAGSLVVFGTVLPWLGSGWRNIAAANGAAFRASLAEQVADWTRIRAEDPRRELCVAGDFNQDLLTEGHYYGSKAGRAAVRSALDTSMLSCPTSDPNDAVHHHTAGRAAGIDHICISAGLSMATDSAHVWPAPEARGATLSDHFGVCITVAAS
jgi:hypothetical protein